MYIKLPHCMFNDNQIKCEKHKHCMAVLGVVTSWWLDMMQLLLLSVIRKLIKYI